MTSNIKKNKQLNVILLYVSSYFSTCGSILLNLACLLRLFNDTNYNNGNDKETMTITVKRQNNPEIIFSLN